MSAFIGLLIPFLSGKLGRLLMAVALAGGVWLYIKTYYENRGVAKERAKIERAGKQNAKKARRIRRQVKKIPDKSLFDHYFRD